MSQQYGGYNTQGGYGQSNRYDQPGGNAYAQQGGNPYAQEAPSHGGYGSYGGGSYGGQQPQQPQQARSDDRYGQGQNNGYGQYVHGESKNLLILINNQCQVTMWRWVP